MSFLLAKSLSSLCFDNVTLCSFKVPFDDLFIVLIENEYSQDYVHYVHKGMSTFEISELPNVSSVSFAPGIQHVTPPLSKDQCSGGTLEVRNDSVGMQCLSLVVVFLKERSLVIVQKCRETLQQGKSRWMSPLFSQGT